MAELIQESQIDFDGRDIAQSPTNKASSDKFLVVLDIPPIMKPYNTTKFRSENTVNLNLWQFSPAGIKLPKIGVKANTLPWMGQNLTVTSQVRNAPEELAITFRIDNKFCNYHLLRKWFDVMNREEDSGMNEHFAKAKAALNINEFHPFPFETKNDTPDKETYRRVDFKNSFDDYKTDITVFGLDEYNNKAIMWFFYRVFITEVGGIDYSYTDQKELVCTANFSYSQVRMELLNYDTI